MQITENFEFVCHPERNMHSQEASAVESNFCEVQRSKRAKARSDSDEGISKGYTIALVRKVTFAKKAIKALLETPKRFAFCS